MHRHVEKRHYCMLINDFKKCDMFIIHGEIKYVLAILTRSLYSQYNCQCVYPKNLKDESKFYLFSKNTPIYT